MNIGFEINDKMEIDEKQVFSLIQKAKESGKIRIGVNEVTKALERGQAKLVANASDVSPAEIVAHLPGLAKEMKAIHCEAGSKSELGAAVGIKATSAVAILDAGSAKKELEALQKEAAKGDKKEEAPKAEKPTESESDDKKSESAEAEAPKEEAEAKKEE